jgi:hypothetical protein
MAEMRNDETQWDENAFAASVMRDKERWHAEAMKQDAAEQRALEDAKADASAVWALADFYLPPDLKGWAASHKIPEFTAHTWRSAFVAGWRAANRFNVGED